jgi:hypothetical protein
MRSELGGVRYTVWSRGRLLGETDLGFIYRENGHRTGWFHPNELGDRLMSAATGVAPALRTRYMIGPDANIEADVRSAGDHEEALALELRGPGGAAIETESIAIIDTHYLLSIPDDDTLDEWLEPLTAEEQAEIDEIVDEWRAEHDVMDALGSEEEPDMPRYQIQVRMHQQDWEL